MGPRLRASLMCEWVLLVVVAATGVIAYVLGGGPVGEGPDRAQVSGTLLAAVVIFPPAVPWAWSHRRPLTLTAVTAEQAVRAAGSGLGAGWWEEHWEVPVAFRHGRAGCTGLCIARKGVCAVVIEAGVVAGYVIAWAVRKARRAGGRLDAEVDTAIDAGLDKLHEVVAAKLGAHPVLDDLGEEAAAEDGQVSDLTRQQVELAITAAAHKDDAFGQTVTDLVAQLRAAEQASGTSVVAGPGSRVFTGDAHAEARDGGIAFGQVGGNVHTGSAGRAAADPPGPGRPGH